MAGKTGKRGHHTGRTVRSPFARTARREGILVKKVRQTGENSITISAEGLVNSINYSLGKKKRWLLPEVIKSSANPHEIVGEESDFVLVEQRVAQVGRRTRCISVYESSTRRVRKPRHRYGEAQSLKSESNQADLEFEVQYPVGKGSWPLNSEVKFSEKCRGKKDSSKYKRGKWSVSLVSDMIEEDDYFSDEDEEDYDENADNYDGMYFEESHNHSRCTSLGDYLFVNQVQQPCIQQKFADKAVRGQSKCTFKNNIIIIDDKELVDEHERLAAEARVMNSLILNSLKPKKRLIRNSKNKRRRRKQKRSKEGIESQYSMLYGWKRKEMKKIIQLEEMAKKKKELNYIKNRATKEYALLREEEKNNPSTENGKRVTEQSPDFTPENYPSFEVSLQGTEILPSELRKTWGRDYREGCCVPRKFAINLTGVLKSPSKDIDLAVMMVLFELKKSEVKNSDICKALVKLVLHDGLSELNTSLETTKLIKREFLDHLSMNNSSDVCCVNEIINAGAKAIEKYGLLKDQKPSRISEKKPFYTPDVFEEVLGYQGKSCSEREVLVQAKEELMKIHVDENDFEDSSVSSSCIPEAECGICFEDLNNEGSQNHTTLVSCGHSFCNSCWEVYIKSMLNMGVTDLLCPGHQCKTPLDDITIMSLASSWYGKYFSWKIRRSITKNPDLKHCPSEGCNLVMQVTTPCKTMKMKSTTTPLPVVCACNQSWCFKCQEPAHWPSQCEKAQEFRDEYKEYARNYNGGDKRKEITSVRVKKCPTCSYPIQKFHGCHHMHCTFCDTHFCWQCLSSIRGHNYFDCEKRRIATSEVQLPLVPKTKMQALTDVALSSQHARKSTNLIAVQRRLKSMEQGINAYCFLKTRALKTHHSRLTSILEGMIKQNTLMHVKDAFNFKSQAHVVLEGLAIILLKGGKKCDVTLQNDLMRLVFIIEGLDNLLKNPCSVCNEEAINKLTELIKRGKMCVRGIKRHVKN